jgi:hypothetical protein
LELVKTNIIELHTEMPLENNVGIHIVERTRKEEDMGVSTRTM